MALHRFDTSLGESAGDTLSDDLLQALKAVRLDDFSGPELAILYKELTGKTIKRFHNKEEGIRRLRPIVADTILKLERSRKSIGQTPRRRKRKKWNFPPRQTIQGYRQGTKRAKLIEMLLKGATFEECQEMLGTYYKLCYCCIYQLHNHLGFGIRENDDGVIQIYTAKEES